MANIKKRENKKGVVFSIRVYDKRLKSGEATMTFKPDKSLTARQAEKEAQKRAIEFEDEIKAKLDSGEMYNNVTFLQLAERWLYEEESLGSMKSSTIERNKQLKERTYAAIGKIKITELNRNQIADFIISLTEPGVNQRTGGGLSTKTQKHYLTFISDVCNYAIDNHMIMSNPARGVKVKKVEAKEKNVYTLEEVQTILTKLESSNAPLHHKVLFNMLAYTGMRRGEVLGLEWKDINLQTGELHIKRTSNYRGGSTGVYTDSPKTKSSIRAMILPENVIAMLAELYAERLKQKADCGDQWVENDRLFIQWNGQPTHPNSPYTWLERFCKREGIEFKGLHSFRHFFATNAIISGKCDIQTVSNLLGHSQTTTTLNIYTHEVKAANIQALNFVADLIQTC